MKKLLGWAVQGETALLRKMVEMLEMKTRERKEGNVILLFAITDPPVFQEAGTNQVR